MQMRETEGSNYEYVESLIPRKGSLGRMLQKKKVDRAKVGTFEELRRNSESCRQLLVSFQSIG